MRLQLLVPLRWGDLDAFNHVNNVSLLKILEEARVRALWAPITAGEAVPPTAVIGPERSARADGGRDATLTLIARQEIEYLAPIEYRRDPICISMWFGSLGGASFDLCYEVTDARRADDADHSERRGDGGVSVTRDEDAPAPTVYARASASVVLVDAASMRPRRISAEEREAWSPYLEEPIAFRRR
ncbi:MAG: acyl-CoA thioesterase [Mycetocola sp.]